MINKEKILLRKNNQIKRLKQIQIVKSILIVMINNSTKQKIPKKSLITKSKIQLV